MNVLEVALESGQWWSKIEGFEGLQRTSNEEFKTIEWRLDNGGSNRNNVLEIGSVGSLVNRII